MRPGAGPAPGWAWPRCYLGEQMAYGLLSPQLMGSPQSLQSALQPQGGLLQRLLGTSGSSRIGQRLTDILDPRVALPMAGELMGGRTFQSGLGEAMKLGGLGLGQIKSERKTKEYLTKAHPELARMVDMGLPITEAWKQALSLDYPDKSNWVNDGDGNLFNTTTGEWKSAPGKGGAGSLFTGKSVEAQGLNYLVESGQLTQDQAAQLAAGKIVTNPVDGSITFATPQGIFSQPAGGGAPQPLGAAQSSTGDPLVAPTGGNPGLIPITGPKPIKETETQRNRKSQVDQATKAVESGLDTYEALVKKSGLSVVPGAEQDALNATRQGIMLQMKELFNLGVLNGPDLMLMEKMIYDPVVSSDSGYGKLAGQGLTALGVGGTAASRASASVRTLKAQLKQIRDSVMSAQDGTVPPPGGGADYISRYGLTPP